MAGHDHHHSQVEKPRDFTRAFAVGIGLNVFFVAVEAGYGFMANSMALISDAGHNLSDVLGLVLAWGAAYLAGRKPTVRRTYGFRRTTILASLTSALLLLMALGAIVWESIKRLMAPAPVSSGTIIVVACIGVVVNTVTALLFVSGRKTDLNIKGAFLHMAADAGVSLGVVIAGASIWLTSWLWIDPAVSLAVVAVIFAGTWGLLHESFNLVIDAVPKHIDPHEVRDFLTGLPEVMEIHDLHIWAMSTTETALSAHLVVSESMPEKDFLGKVAHSLRSRFGIGHSTLQVEQLGADEICRRYGICSR